MLILMVNKRLREVQKGTKQVQQIKVKDKKNMMKKHQGKSMGLNQTIKY